MLKGSVLILSLSLGLVGCSSGGGQQITASSNQSAQINPYSDYKVGLILDKLEDYNGFEYAIEVNTDSGSMTAEVSKTEFERARVGEKAYYKYANPLVFAPSIIRVPNIEQPKQEVVQ